MKIDIQPNQQILATWPKIAEISDSDLGFTKDQDNPHIRYTVRVLALNDQGQICFVKSEKYQYLQILGGGIDPGETIEQAAHREIAEEGGIKITNLQPIGYVTEHRQNHRNHHDWGHSVSFVFAAQATDFIGTHYMPDEIAEGFHPVWLNLTQAIKEFTTYDNRHYGGAFSVRRDSAILRTLSLVSL